MTLKWYAEGKECKIKIKIDANGVDLVKGDDFSLERLEVNRDVKIGGLFLHEIQFREKGQGKANEMQHNKDSNELSSETTTRIDVNRGVSVQATDITQKKKTTIHILDYNLTAEGSLTIAELEKILTIKLILRRLKKSVSLDKQHEKQIREVKFITYNRFLRRILRTKNSSATST